MKTPVQSIAPGGIPALLWGPPSDHLYLHVHGKMASKECAEAFAAIAAERGWQTLSFDLPDHGERRGRGEVCDIFSGMRDLQAVGEYAFSRWKTVGLFACSLGAYFSLMTWADRPFDNCLFQSPILDMEHLVQNMFLWFGVTEERLEREREIPTPIDTLSWDYYQFVRSHPVDRWTPPTRILYAAKDNLQSRAVIDAFCAAHGCALTVSESSEHPFMAPGDEAIVDAWLRASVPKI